MSEGLKDSVANAVETFTKTEVIDKYSELIKNLQNKINNDLIGSAVWTPEEVEKYKKKIQMENTNSQVPSQGQVIQKDKVPEIGDGKSILEFKDMVKKVLEEFKEYIKKFESNYTNDRNIFFNNNNINKDDEYTKDYVRMLDDIMIAINKSFDQIIEGFDNIGRDIQENKKLDSTAETIVCNTVIYALFVRINAIYTTTLLEIMKENNIGGFTLDGEHNILRDYLNEKIKDLPDIKDIDLKNYNKKVEEVNLMIGDILPRTKSSLIKHTLGGSRKKAINLIKYKRSDLNKLGKKIGLTNIKSIKNKKVLVQKINTLIFFKAGGFRNRKDLNIIATYVGINPKFYRRKKNLMSKLNKTIF